MHFDDSRLRKALDKMNENAQKQQKPLAVRQANFFLRLTKKISLQNAPDPIEILDLERKYGGRLKRKRGVTVPQEIGRRILMIGTLARNWRVWKIDSQRWSIRIWIRDNVKYSKTVDDRLNLAAQAATIVRKSFKKSLDKMAQKLTQEFNRG